LKEIGNKTQPSTMPPKNNIKVHGKCKNISNEKEDKERFLYFRKEIIIAYVFTL